MSILWKGSPTSPTQGCRDRYQQIYRQSWYISVLSPTGQKGCHWSLFAGEFPEEVVITGCTFWYFPKFVICQHPWEHSFHFWKLPPFEPIPKVDLQENWPSSLAIWTPSLTIWTFKIFHELPMSLHYSFSA